MREMLAGGDLDYLTGDYLAELTMLILARDRMKYARPRIRQDLPDPARAVPRAGARPRRADRRQRRRAEPRGAGRCRPRAGRTARTERQRRPRRGRRPRRPRAAELGFGTPLAANAYLGAWGIVDCLDAGADVVVTGRVTDASVIVGPAAAHFGWSRTDYDATRRCRRRRPRHRMRRPGHRRQLRVLHRGARPDLSPGFPIAEIDADGSSVITKHPGTGGLVSVDTVTAQLLYEITRRALRQSRRHAAGGQPSRSTQDGPDRVRISGVRGEPPPPTLKVSLNSIGGFRNAMTFVLTGLDIEAKADLVRRQLEAALTVKPAELEWTLARTDHPDADTEEAASALLRCVVRDPDPAKVGRQFSSAAVELALASYPGFTTTAPPGDGQVYGVFTAGYVDASAVPHVAVHADGTRTDIAAGHRDAGARARRAVRTARTAARSARRGACRWAPSPAPAAATRAATPTSASGCARRRRSGAGWPTR